MGRGVASRGEIRRGCRYLPQVDLRRLTRTAADETG